MKIARPLSQQPIPPHAQKVFQGVIFDVFQWEQKLFNGKKATFEKLKRPDTVVILPVLPDGRILLIKEKQPGRKIVLGVPGGRIDADEGPLTAAKRELLEETGYAATEFLLWEATQPILKIDWAIFTFIAKDMKKVAHQHLDAGEKISLTPVTFEEFLEISLHKHFLEKHITQKVLEAKADPARMRQLQEKFRSR